VLLSLPPVAAYLKAYTPTLLPSLLASSASDQLEQLSDLQQLNPEQLIVQHFDQLLGALCPYTKTQLAKVGVEGLTGPTMAEHVPTAVLVRGQGGLYL
jgi:hypothetical protein